jgi:hypothetical protein
MSKNTKKDNVVQMDFGTTEPRITETTEEEMLTQEQLDNVCLGVGRSTLEWAMMATKEEFVQHMAELYDILNNAQGETDGN